MWLRSQIGSSGIEVATVRRFARDLLRRAGVNISSGKSQGQGFWESVVKRALDEASAEILENPWDAVVIDEGQDLTAEDWQLVEALAGDRGRIWAFHDPAQAFWTDRVIPSSLFAAHWKLGRAYRCHPSIQGLADLYLGKEECEPAVREGIEADRIRLVAAQKPDKVSQTVGREIDLLIKDGFERKQIAVVSVVGQGRSRAAGGSKTIGVHQLVRADDPAMEREVVSDTFLRFKGLERPAVIVTDLGLIPKGERGNRTVRMHIAVTRAQSALRIVADVDSLRADPVLGKFI
jgi:superfamily I DNA and RNA helicase